MLGKGKRKTQKELASLFNKKPRNNRTSDEDVSEQNKYQDLSVVQPSFVQIKQEPVDINEVMKKLNQFIKECRNKELKNKKPKDSELNCGFLAKEALLALHNLLVGKPPDDVETPPNDTGSEDEAEITRHLQAIKTEDGHTKKSRYWVNAVSYFRSGTSINSLIHQTFPYINIDTNNESNLIDLEADKVNGIKIHVHDINKTLQNLAEKELKFQKLNEKESIVLLGHIGFFRPGRSNLYHIIAFCVTPDQTFFIDAQNYDLLEKKDPVYTDLCEMYQFESLSHTNNTTGDFIDDAFYCLHKKIKIILSTDKENTIHDVQPSQPTDNTSTSVNSPSLLFEKSITYYAGINVKCHASPLKCAITESESEAIEILIKMKDYITQIGTQEALLLLSTLDGNACIRLAYAKKFDTIKTKIISLYEIVDVNHQGIIVLFKQIIQGNFELKFLEQFLNDIKSKYNFIFSVKQREELIISVFEKYTKYKEELQMYSKHSKHRSSKGIVLYKIKSLLYHFKKLSTYGTQDYNKSLIVGIELNLPLEVLTLLIHEGNINGSDENMMSPLMVAIKNRRYEHIKFLINHQADLKVVSKFILDNRMMEGNALEYAQHINVDSKIINLLKKYTPVNLSDSPFMYFSDTDASKKNTSTSIEKRPKV